MQGFRKDYGYSVPTKHNSVATCKTQQEIARFVLLEILCVGCEEAARIDCSGDSTTRMTLCVAHRSVICDTVPWWQKTATACSWKSAILSRRICKSDVWAIWLSLVGGFVLFCFVLLHTTTGFLNLSHCIAKYLPKCGAIVLTRFRPAVRMWKWL